MEKELKQRWVADLRSGNYKQIIGQLKEKGGYCCLGVLCETAGEVISKDGMGVINEKGDEAGYVPLLKYLTNDQIDILYGMNDDKKKSFSEIADYIDQNL